MTRLFLTLLLLAPVVARAEPVTCTDLRQAEVVRVVDGDTFQAVIDLGFHLSLTKHVRLLGYNAPESRGAEKAWGVQATAALRAMLPVGAHVFLEPHGDDAFGRVLAVVVLSSAPAESVVDRLVREGWGVRWDGRGKRPVPWMAGAAYPIREVTQ